MKFKIYRYNPETDAAPYMQDYELETEPAGKMLLDALLLLKEQDDSLGMRKSCREGVCGSDAMNINGATVWPASRRWLRCSSRSRCVRCRACQ